MLSTPTSISSKSLFEEFNPHYDIFTHTSFFILLRSDWVNNYRVDEISRMCAYLGVGEEVSNEDVLKGRGGHNNHVGNQIFRAHFLELQPAYERLSHREKTEWIIAGIQWVHDRGGRFLIRDSPDGLWYIATEEEAHKKVSQVFREEGLTPEGRARKRARTEANRVTP